jgi:gamma-glutamylputrescine oxidase
VSTPLWLEEEEAPLFPRRSRPGRAAAAVVGGGVTGCACALALARGGLRVSLYEARTIASGASGRNGGFALRGAAMPYDEARRLLGEDDARRLWLLTERWLKRLEELAGDAFRRVGSLRLAADAAERAELRSEYDALRADGFTVEWLEEPPAALSASYVGALLHPVDGSLQPARWVRRLAGLAAEAGVEVRERTPVASLQQLEADRIVIATDGYTCGLLPELDSVVRRTRGQMLATEPLPELLFERPHYARQGFDYWQQTPDRRLVAGGRRDVSLDSESTGTEAVTPKVQGAIEQLVRQLLGRLPAITHRWSGLFGITPDRLPLAGAVPHRGGIWVACGYSGHGNVLGLACGELVARAILGEETPELALFDPARLL